MIPDLIRLLPWDALNPIVGSVALSDLDGEAYGAAIEADGAAVTPGYPEEQWLFATLRAQGVLSKIVDGFIRGHNNNTANNRKLITRGQGAISGTVTPSSGKITYGAVGYCSYVTNLNAQLTDVNSHGILVDVVAGANLGNANAMKFTTGVENGPQSIMNQLAWEDGYYYVRLGANGGAAFFPLVAFAPGMHWMTRTSANTGALYRFNGVTFETIATNSGLSGGSINALPLYTGCENYANAYPYAFIAYQERLHLVTLGVTDVEAEIIMEIFYTYYDMKGWV